MHQSTPLPTPTLSPKARPPVHPPPSLDSSPYAPVIQLFVHSLASLLFLLQSLQLFSFHSRTILSPLPFRHQTRHPFQSFILCPLLCALSVSFPVFATFSFQSRVIIFPLPNNQSENMHSSSHPVFVQSLASFLSLFQFLHSLPFSSGSFSLHFHFAIQPDVHSSSHSASLQPLVPFPSFFHSFQLSSFQSRVIIFPHLNSQPARHRFIQYLALRPGSSFAYFHSAVHPSIYSVVQSSSRSIASFLPLTQSLQLFPFQSYIVPASTPLRHPPSHLHRQPSSHQSSLLVIPLHLFPLF